MSIMWTCKFKTIAFFESEAFSARLSWIKRRGDKATKDIRSTIRKFI
jgi:hypothetical protein